MLSLKQINQLWLNASPTVTYSKRSYGSAGYMWPNKTFSFVHIAGSVWAFPFVIRIELSQQGRFSPILMTQRILCQSRKNHQAVVTLYCSPVNSHVLILKMSSLPRQNRTVSKRKKWYYKITYQKNFYGDWQFRKSLQTFHQLQRGTEKGWELSSLMESFFFHSSQEVQKTNPQSR